MRAEVDARLFRGGEVVTLDDAQPSAAAVATAAARILAVGTEPDCRRALASAGHERFEEVDLGGGVLLPGFIDTHLHPIPIVVFELNPDLGTARDIDEVVARLRASEAACGPDEWVLGLQLDDEALPEKRLPSRHDLDRVSATRPVVVLERDGHCSIGNSAALAAAGITRDTPDPAGGRIDREPDGMPAGPCREAAGQILLGGVPMPPIDRVREAGRRAFRRIVSHGITSVGAVIQSDDEGPAGGAGAIELLAMQLLLDETPFCTYAIVIGRTAEAAEAARTTTLHEPEAGRRVGGFKIFADGTFGGHTACMHQPFADSPEDAGFLVHDEEVIYERMCDAHRRGLQVCVHAIGDRAVTRCIDLYEKLLAEHPRRDARHRIEHASLVTPGEARRLARLGIAVSTQPLFIHSEKAWLHERLGAARARHTYPLRDLLDAGVRMGGASDAPIESTSVLHAIECCVTREGFEPGQAIDAAEALRLFTSDAAWLQFEEHEKGTISPGKRADLVILDASPLAVPAERIREIQVQRTIVGGRDVYRRDAEELDSEGKQEIR
jgi:predicted amidohydrolase YtcJ